jgi:hypothetical protein
LVTVTIIGPTNTWIEPALLDPGADDTVLPDLAATKIGLDLTNAPTGTASGVATGIIPLRFARVTLRLTDGQEFREWEALVGFTSAPLKFPLLGFAGCLQFFTSTFFGHLEEVELTVNPLYAGR